MAELLTQLFTVRNSPTGRREKKAAGPLPTQRPSGDETKRANLYGMPKCSLFLRCVPVSHPKPVASPDDRAIRPTVTAPPEYLHLPPSHSPILSATATCYSVRQSLLHLLDVKIRRRRQTLQTFARLRDTSSYAPSLAAYVLVARNLSDTSCVKVNLEKHGSR